MDANKALSKCMQICSKAEYCIFDIEQKLIKWEISLEDQSLIIERLIGDKFLNEERYVHAFVKDKFRFNRWGKTKITFMLRQKNISGSMVSEALQLIEDQEYSDVIQEEMKKKWPTIKGVGDYEKKAKLVRFFASRGFETDLIYKIYDQHINNY